MLKFFEKSIYDELEEQELIRKFFGDGQFTFIDVGANLPHNSISTPLEKMGWSGVVIEPQPDCILALKKTRKCTIVECACVSKKVKNGKLKLWLAGPQSSLDITAYTNRNRPKDFIFVNTKTLTEICMENNIHDIDLLSIDVEGAEIEVMKGLNWDEFSPKLILIEDFARDFDKHNFLVNKGYVLFRRTSFNAWYAKPKDALYVSPYGRWQLFRKYYLGGPLRNFRRWRHNNFKK